MNNLVEGKVVVLGSQSVGKTSLVSKYISNVCSDKIGPTIGASFSTCNINIEDIRVRLQIWDTAGQERFRAMAPLYYRNANGALLVFDITNHQSFVDVKSWMLELHKNIPDPLTIALVGNKIDLEDDRAVSREEASLYACSIGAAYFETSAVQDFNVEPIFIAMALGICNRSGRSPSISNGFSTSMGGVQLAEELENSGMVTGIGRVESGSWQRENIAHGDVKNVGFCCF